jgi:hypothetical protein
LPHTSPLRAFIQFLKRLGIFFLEALVPILAFILMAFLCAGITYLWNMPLYLIVFLSLGVPTLCFLWVRQIGRPFQIRYDAARFLAARRAAALYPRRARYLRMVRPYLLWFPSACALLVLLFFPQASHLFHLRSEPGDLRGSIMMFFPRMPHLFHPGADQAIHNQISIPWNWTIAYSANWPDFNSTVYTICPGQTPWPFGNKSFWDKTARLCSVSFSSITPAALIERRERRVQWPQRQREETTVTLSQINSHGILLTCRRYQTRWTTESWLVDCETTSQLQPANFDAQFFGPEGDIPSFYQIIQNVSPAH